MFPDFIGIGAQKAGTTWLYENLQAHPQIYMPRKELQYFNLKFEDGSGAFTRLFGKREADREWRRQVRNRAIVHFRERPSLQDLLYEIRYYAGSYNDEWYASLFEPGRGKVKGEITPAYSVLGKERIAHIYNVMPDAKVILLMRNPIERVWSQLVMRFDNVDKISAESAREDQLTRRAGRSTRLFTDYLRTLENWGAFYQENQIFVGFLEDVSRFPGKLLKDIYEFLEVEPFFEPPALNKKVHSRSSNTMPTHLAVHLAHEYREETGRLAEVFGGYATFWSYCTRRLVEDPPQEERIPYPLWKSSLWNDWTEELPVDAETGLHSGPLSTIQVAK